MWLSIFIIAFATLASCLDNGLCKTPPMGWNSYNYMLPDSMVKHGFLDAGYKYLNIRFWINYLRQASWISCKNFFSTLQKSEISIFVIIDHEKKNSQLFAEWEVMIIATMELSTVDYEASY
ncbi:Glycoside Hydrolase Family 27 protein [Gigaspora rosea]|uniref:alpha-galactosidase n=1 Tax=Gigaspora rosea TaxID=44941 RepID=A0A397TT35_9GLOM|nr:Glycoside Hydrolase Family 27 protein [Gigaspora rosea]